MPVQGGRGLGGGGGGNKRSLFFFLALRYVANVTASIVTPGGHVTVEFNYTCVRENVVCAIKCRT